MGSLHRVIWRWHFYAGMIVAPVLMVMAVTGGIYVFEAELQTWFDRELYYPSAGVSRASLDRQLDSARAAAPQGFEVASFSVPEDTQRSTEVFVRGPDEFRRELIDPFTGAALGSPRSAWFFDLVLRIHRTLLAGTFGRIVTELTTCWLIVLLVTGLYLWWPRRWSRLGGVWLPRLGGHRYVVLRDLHAIAGVAALPLALAIAGSGLLYTYVWGRGYFLAATRSAEVQALLETPPSRSALDAPSLSADEIVAIARRHSPEGWINVQLPAAPQQAVVCSFWGEGRPVAMTRLVLDRASGEVLHAQRTADLPTLAWWSRWNYPTHVGSLLGWTTKALWFAAALVLTCLPITGVWMWWQRRPRGTLGLPRKRTARIPLSVWALILGLGLAMPTLGVSLLIVGLVECFLVRSPA